MGAACAVCAVEQRRDVEGLGGLDVIEQGEGVEYGGNLDHVDGLNSRKSLEEGGSF